MADEPIDLDKHRCSAAQKTTEIHRRLAEIESVWHTLRLNEYALAQQQDEFERNLLSTPALTWPEAAATARYLLQLFAMSPDAEAPRRQTLIARTIEDLNRLSVAKKEP